MNRYAVLALVLGLIAMVAVASVPYLWHVRSEATRVTLLGFLAWQYLIGSTLFLAGGVFNYWRAYAVVLGMSRESRERSGWTP